MEYYNLRAIEPGSNILIIGPKNCGKSVLQENILHILKTKNYVVENSHEPEYAHVLNNKSYHTYKYKKNKFRSVVIYNNDYAPSWYNNSDYVFVHSTYIYKKEVARTYFNCNSIDNIINYSSPHTFFILHYKTLALCNAEHDSTYLTNFNRMPFCYDNITKLNTNILRNFSVYHKTNGNVHTKLQTRLKELDVAYCIIFCVKNNVNENTWLPTELNLEIIKLLYLSCL